jgi:hypothetical protein
MSIYQWSAPQVVYLREDPPANTPQIIPNLKHLFDYLPVFTHWLCGFGFSHPEFAVKAIINRWFAPQVVFLAEDLPPKTPQKNLFGFWDVFPWKGRIPRE